MTLFFYIILEILGQDCAAKLIFNNHAWCNASDLKRKLKTTIEKLA